MPDIYGDLSILKINNCWGQANAAQYPVGNPRTAAVLRLFESNGNQVDQSEVDALEIVGCCRRGLMKYDGTFFSLTPFGLQFLAQNP